MHKVSQCVLLDYKTCLSNIRVSGYQLPISVLSEISFRMLVVSFRVPVVIFIAQVVFVMVT